MGLLAFFDSLFPAPPKSSTTKSRLEDINRRIVMRFSRGNVGLQDGKYVTSDDIKRMRARARR